MRIYDHQKIERKWQEIWDKTNLYQTKEEDKEQKFYSLVMFPYPSGNMHIGHWYNFAPADTYSRFIRMKGFNVLNPIGFDAFGLPAENAAIKRGVAPRAWTYENIKTMTQQLKTMGPSYDWNRTVVTSDLDYYKWTQWMFLLLYRKGLAYKKKAIANWCPSCNTVLANEQVVAGRCERCNAEVIQKEIDQWLFKITDYAERLLSDLENLDWPEKTKVMQQNWIGKSEGAIVKFKVHSEKLKALNSSESLNKQTNGKKQTANSDNINVFTTRPDTIFGATFLVLAPEHPLVSKIVTQEMSKKITQYVKKTAKKTELERIAEEKKTGCFTGAYALNPVTDEKIPIWISDYVLVTYGTGAIMAVPAHDERDWQFSQKFSLPVKEVVIPKVIDRHDPPKEGVKTVYRRSIQVLLINPKNKKVLVLKWKKFPWTTFVTGGIEEGEDEIAAAKREVLEETGYGKIKYVRTLGGPVESHYYAAHKNINRKAHFTALVFELTSEERSKISKKEAETHEIDWLSWNDLGKDKNIKCAEYQIWLDRLSDPDHVFSGNGVSINSGEFTGLETEAIKAKIISWLESKSIGTRAVNYKLRDWVVSRQRYWGAPIPIIYCDKCGEVPIPEKDLPVVLPEVIKFKSTGESPLKYDKQFIKAECPQCHKPARRETDTLDTFVCSSWYYLRYIDPKNKAQFADKKKLEKWMPIDMYIGGAEHSVLHLLYSRFFTKVLKDAGYLKISEPFKRLRHQGIILGPDNQKMSKSKGNVIDPDSLVEKFGSDSVRMFLEFMGPYELGGPWQSGGIGGIYKFIQKIWKLFSGEISDVLPSIETQRLEAKTIKKVTEDLEQLRFNTAISALMIYVNYLQKENILAKKTLETLNILIAPFAPHLAEEIWSLYLGGEDSIHTQKWPIYNQKLISDLIIPIAVQINGKIRGQLLVNPEIEEDEIVKLAREDLKLGPYLKSKEMKKIIYIKRKILSIVI